MLKEHRSARSNHKRTSLRSNQDSVFTCVRNIAAALLQTSPRCELGFPLIRFIFTGQIKNVRNTTPHQPIWISFVHSCCDPTVIKGQPDNPPLKNGQQRHFFTVPTNDPLRTNDGYSVFTITIYKPVRTINSDSFLSASQHRTLYNSAFLAPDITNVTYSTHPWFTQVTHMAQDRRKNAYTTLVGKCLGKDSTWRPEDTDG